MITSDSHVFHLNYTLLKAEKGRIQRTEVSDVLQQGANIDDEIITRRRRLLRVIGALLFLINKLVPLLELDTRNSLNMVDVELLEKDVRRR